MYNFEPLCLGIWKNKFLPTVHFVALRPRVPIWQTHSVQAFLLKPAPLCKHFPGISSTNKIATSLPFSSQNLTLFFLHFYFVCSFFYLLLSGISGRNYYSSSTIRLQCTMGAQSFVFPGNIPPNELARQDTLLQPSLVSISLLPFIFILLFTRAGSILSYQNFRHPSSLSIY